MTEATDLAATWRTQVATNVQHAVSEYAHRASLLIRTSPQGDIASILTRPDLAAFLDTRLASAQAKAEDAVRRAWAAAGGPDHHQMLNQLLLDVTHAYNGAPEDIRHAVINAWHAISPQEFHVGEDEPGTNPVREVAEQRAQAVVQALAGQGAALATRNGLSVNVAATGGDTAAILAAAPPGSSKRWVASMDGKDPKSCAWCRALHGTTVPVAVEFPHPEAIAGHKPPRVYKGKLPGCPLHPNCQCHIEIVVAGEPEATTPPPPPPEPDLVSSDDIRDMPEERYQSLLGFLQSALHELAVVIKTLLGINRAN